MYALCEKKKLDKEKVFLWIASVSVIMRYIISALCFFANVYQALGIQIIVGRSMFTTIYIPASGFIIGEKFRNRARLDINQNDVSQARSVNKRRNLIAGTIYTTVATYVMVVSSRYETEMLS